MKRAPSRVVAGWPALPESVTLLGVPVVSRKNNEVHVAAGQPGEGVLCPRLSGVVRGIQSLLRLDGTGTGVWW
jgi:hypothetical protein